MISHARLASLSIAGALLLPSTVAYPDGGAVRLRQSVGTSAITVFSATDPVTVGPMDVSVLVQDRTDETPVLDATVKLRLTSRSAPDRPGRVLETTATHDVATNKLLYAAWIDVAADDSRLDVAVRRGDETSSVSVPFVVVPSVSRLTDYWPHLLFPPLAILSFVLHQCLARARRPTG